MTGKVSNPKNEFVGGIIGYTYGSSTGWTNAELNNNASRRRRLNHYSPGRKGSVNRNFTFYGTIENNHSRSSDVFGEGSGDEIHESFTDSELATYLNSFSGNDLYRYAVKYPFAINVTTEGYGSVGVSAGGETGITRWRPGQTITLIQKSGFLQSVTVKDADDNTISVSGNATDGYTFTMPKRDVNVTAVFNPFAWPRYGDGSEKKPYLIDSQLDWHDFAASVESGNSYSGKFVKLNANISTMEMCGISEDKPFSGTFDGGGHDINSYINNNICEGAAPFRYISGATIKNLTVSGHLYGANYAAGIVGYSKGTGNRIENCAVSASIYGGTHIGGILGHGLNSDITITNCVFSGRIICGSIVGIFFGWGDDGGAKSVTNCLYLMKSGQSVVGLDLVRMNAGSVTVSDCYKTCKEGTYGIQVSATLPDNEIYKPVTAARNTTCYMLCTVNGVDEVYHHTGSVINIVPSLTAADGTELTANTDYTYTLNPATVQERGDYTLTITSQGGNYLGTKTINFTVLGEGDAIAVTSESTTLANESYQVSEDVTINSRITINGNVVLKLGEGATLYAKKGIELSSDNNANLTIEGPGTLTIDDCDENNSGIGAKKVGTLTINGGTINVIGGNTAAGIGGKKIIPYYLTLAGDGSPTSPFLISSTDDWNAFCEYVADGMVFNGKTLKLTQNITVTTMVGTDDANSFQGTFDGDNNTLTVNYNTSEAWTAPFRHVKNAVIKNLHVDGTITTSAQFAGGIVAESHGALTITGCRSSVAINSGKNGDGTHGGLVSTLSGSGNDITIDGCLFDGSFATTNGTTNCGGFVGWPVWNRPTIKNSLMKPSSVDEGMLNNTFARRHDGYEPTITNCYYVAADNMPTNQGLGYSFTSAPVNFGTAGEAYTTSGITPYTNGLLYDGRYYMTPEAMSLANNADNSTTISDADGHFTTVTLTDRTLYKDGAWNTICLPFDVTLAGSPLAGAEARQLTAASISGTTLHLTFGDEVTTLVAGTPYIIKWASGDNIVSPVFSGVTIDKTDRSYDNGVSGEERVRFLGTYKSTMFDSEDKSILFLGDANTLYYPLSGVSLGAQRAYFKIGTDGGSARQITDFDIDFGDSSETTGILNSQISNLNSSNAAWYTINGVKLDAKPNSKGGYIHGNKKVVIK